MRIKLTNNLFIDPGTSQWTLFEKSVIKEGKTKGQEIETALGYFISLEDLLKWVSRYTLSKSEQKEMNLLQAIAELRRLYEQMSGLVNVNK